MRHWLEHVKTPKQYADDRARYQGYINRLQAEIERLRAMNIEHKSLAADRTVPLEGPRRELHVVNLVLDLFLSLEGKSRVRAMRYVLELLEDSP